MRQVFYVPLEQRVLLALTQVALSAEAAEAKGHALTDSDVLDAVERWALWTCPEACTGVDCCDYQTLGALVWRVVERLR